MDENLQQSDAWRELVIPRDNGWMYFLKAGVCANFWPFPQVVIFYPLVSSNIHILKKLLKIVFVGQCEYCIYEKGNGRMCLISRLLFFLVMYFGVGGDMFNPNLD